MVTDGQFVTSALSPFLVASMDLADVSSNDPFLICADEWQGATVPDRHTISGTR